MTIPCVVPDGPLGVPPFEKPSIAKVIFVVYKSYLIFMCLSTTVIFMCVFCFIILTSVLDVSETSIMYIPVTSVICHYLAAPV